MFDVSCDTILPVEYVEIQSISVRGELETQHIQACTGSPMNYNQITHEMRVDPTSPDRRVLSTAIKMSEYPKTEIVLREGACPHIERNTIRDQKRRGVVVCARGQGYLVDNTISGSRHFNVEVRGEAPKIASGMGRALKTANRSSSSSSLVFATGRTEARAEVESFGEIGRVVLRGVTWATPELLRLSIFSLLKGRALNT